MSKLSKLLSVLVSLILLVAPLIGWTFNSKANIYVRFVLYVLILLVLGLTLLTRNSKLSLRKQILIPFYFYIMWSVFRITWLNVGINQVIMLMGLLTLIIVLGSTKWNNEDINIITSSGLKMLIVLLVCGFASGFGLGKPMTGFFMNPNLYGGILLSYIFFPLYKLEVETNKRKRKNYSMLTIIASAAILFSFSRASWVGLIIVFITYMYINFLEQRNKTIKLIICMMILLLIIIVLLPHLGNIGIFDLQKLSGVYLGKRLESGRIDMWIDLVKSLKGNYWLGYGTGIEPSLIDGRGLSAHNLYIQVLFQQGVIGLLLLIVLFFSVTRALFVLRSNKLCKVTSVVFLGLLARDFFEVSIIQNNIIISIFIWSMIGISLNTYRINQGQ